MGSEAAAVLAAEVDGTLRVCGLLEQQRDALLDRDLGQIEALTQALEDEFEELASLVSARVGVLTDEAGPGEGLREAARTARAAQARLSVLVALNQAIIGDRLAYVATTLGQIHPGLLAAGYEPDGSAGAVPRGVLSRSA